MFKIISKILSIMLVITFITSQMQPTFAYENLSPAALSDGGIGITRPGIIGEINEEFEPGAIGRGKPLDNMVAGILPEKIDIAGLPVSDVLTGKFTKDAEIAVAPMTLRALRKIAAGSRLAIAKTRANLEEVPAKYRARAEQAVINIAKTLIHLQHGEFEKLHLFRSVVTDEDNFLLGFNRQGIPGLAVDLIDYLTLDEVAEYIFHEHVPEEHKIGHKIVYKKMQRPIFWGARGNTLGLKLGNFIEYRANTEDVDVPTISDRYAKSKRTFSRSAFGDQLVFGTSGIRDFVKYLQSIKCFAIAEAIMSYMEEIGEPTAMAFAGDHRPSTKRVMLTQIMAALKLGRNVINGGNVPTAAVVYYGMYNDKSTMPSCMITASHCPVLPPEIEQNGIKPNRTTGEVLKEDERRILKHVREFMEIEFMLREKQSMFEGNGSLKEEGKLSDNQRDLVKRALKVLGTVDEEVRTMFIDRYVKSFGKIFNKKDKVAFVEHMAVGRDMIKETFAEMGADLSAFERNKDWVEGLIVDTEDIKSKLEKIVEGIAEGFRRKSEKILGIFTTDGDSDRPALFQEDSTFVYGDKLGYLTCEYIRNLKANQGKKMFAAVTATVSDAVVRRMESLGIEVGKVKIGSPYVVKAMEDRLAQAKAAGEEVIVFGFERNGGFLLGSDITLDNGNTLKALPTRDAMLPIICALHTAKKENKTVGELVSDRFSGEYASYGWSGLIDSETIDPENPRNTELCQQYTATMGQAIMRSFSPSDLNIVEVQFNDNGSVTYLTNSGKEVQVDSKDDFTIRMRKIRTTLESYFNEKRALTGGITRINYLDGVRMFFGNLEVVHMRPSGNSPQWRIYSETTTLARAREITEYRLPVYPQIIEKYLEEKKQFEGVRIAARDNQEMKETFSGVFDTKADKWVTWEMVFGGKKEHSLEEGVIFGENNKSVSFYSTRNYDIKTDLEWLPTSDFKGAKLQIERTITWDREDGTLTCKEKFSDGREVSVVLEGPDAWLEIGRGLDKNVPMGKFQDMAFPVMSDKARAYFKEQDIYWFDLFDVSVESEFTIEAPMWTHNFDFKRTAPAPPSVSPGPPSDGSVSDDDRMKTILQPTTVEALKDAQEFYAQLAIEGLRKLLATDPKKEFLLAVNMGIGGEFQQGLMNNLLMRISNLQDEGEFENLLTARGKDGETLASRIRTLVDETEKLDMERVIAVTRQVDIEQNTFEDIQGRAIIAGVEDRWAGQECYMPILETISVALGLGYGADYQAIKSVYDLITTDKDILTVEKFEEIIKNRVIRIIPKATAFNSDDLRAIYEHALEALIRA